MTVPDMAKVGVDDAGRGQGAGAPLSAWLRERSSAMILSRLFSCCAQSCCPLLPPTRGFPPWTPEVPQQIFTAL